MFWSSSGVSLSGMKQNSDNQDQYWSLSQVVPVEFLVCFSSSEYLAVFKKTVSSHEVFLQRLSSHPVLSKDRNFHVFLEYDQDVRHFCSISMIQ